MTTPPTRRVPGWLILLIVIGVPGIVSVAGTLLGAHAVEIVVFSSLCLFSVALMFFYAMG